MRVLLAGVGGAGTRVADRVAAAHRPSTLWERLKAWFSPPDLDLRVVAADAPEAGDGEPEGLRDGERVRLGAGAGAGGDLEAGTRAWRQDGPGVREAAGSEPWDLALVVGGAAGGTAAAAMGPLVEALRDLGGTAPVLAAPILPSEWELDRAHANAGPALSRLRDADAETVVLLANDRLATSQDPSHRYARANDAIARRLRYLLEALAAPGTRTADLGDLRTATSPGNGFSALGHAQGAKGRTPADVVAEALSPEAASADVDPAEEASRVLLLVSGDPEELAVDALLDRAREAVPDREVLVGARAAPGQELRVTALVALARSRAVEAVLDRYESVRASPEGGEARGTGRRTGAAGGPGGQRGGTQGTP